MSYSKRHYKLADSEKRSETNLTDFSDIIIETINITVPGKHPKVYHDHFITDELTHSEAVRIGRALSKIEELCNLGKTVTQFRLFEGTSINHDSSKCVKKKRKVTGGRMA